jgi:predicted RNA-binding protein with PIN domain
MYLIDGNNLIGHTRGLSFRDPQARQRLLDRIIPFLNARRHHATVVFDGPPTPLRKAACLKLIFSGSKASADDKIRHILENSRLPRDLYVVSSDNAVYSYSKTCGAQAMKCHEFNRLVNHVALENSTREDRDQRIDDLKSWMRYFGEDGS